MISFFSTDRIVVESDVPVEWTLDGEREPETSSAEVENLHSAVRIMIPVRGPSTLFDAGKEEAEL